MPSMPVNCPNCGQPFSASVEQLVDVSRDPQAKARLLSGRLNAVQCPNCGFQSALAMPLAYHDPDKQLLIVHVPMELNLPPQEQERVIGSFTNAIVNSLPQEKRKGYLFTPRQALTRQGMIDTILEADGVTKEMIEAQREKMKLVEIFLQAEPEQFPELVKEHDARLDAEFFTIMLAAAEASMANGREDVAQAVVGIREELLRLSSFGQTALAAQEHQESQINEIAGRLNGLGSQVSRDQLLDLILQFACEDDEKLQIAVGLVRTAMDYQFFQILTERLNHAGSEEKEFLGQVRSRLTELTGMVDKQNEAIIRRATDTLRGLLSAEDLDAAINSRLDLFDDTFLAVLQANIQGAEQSRDIASSARLKTIFEKVVAALQASAPPAVKFLNDLMVIERFEDVKARIAERAAEFGPELVEWIDVLLQDMNAQGENSQAADKLGRIRDEVERIFASMPASEAAQQDNSNPVPFAPRILTKDEPPQPPAGKPIIELPSFRRGPRRER